MSDTVKKIICLPARVGLANQRGRFHLKEILQQRGRRQWNRGFKKSVSLDFSELRELHPYMNIKVTGLAARPCTCTRSCVLQRTTDLHRLNLTSEITSKLSMNNSRPTDLMQLAIRQKCEKKDKGKSLRARIMSNEMPMWENREAKAMFVYKMQV